MAAHLRTQLRDAIVAEVTDLVTTGARVFASRVYPLERADLPGLLVRVSQGAPETVEPQTIHSPRMLERVAPIEVVGVARATDDLDDILDQIAKEVEIALAAPAGVLALASDIVLRSTTIDMVDGAEKPLGTVTLQYDVTYYTLDNTPDVSQQ